MIFFFSVRPPNVLQGMNFFMPNDFGPEFMSYFHVLTALVYIYKIKYMLYNILYMCYMLYVWGLKCI